MGSVTEIGATNADRKKKKKNYDQKLYFNRNGNKLFYHPLNNNKDENFIKRCRLQMSPILIFYHFLLFRNWERCAHDIRCRHHPIPTRIGFNLARCFVVRCLRCGVCSISTHSPPPILPVHSTHASR